MEPDDFSDVLEYLLLSDTSSITERNESQNTENNCEFFFAVISMNSSTCDPVVNADNCLC